MTINDRLRSGSFGPTYKCGRIVYVALENVDKATGLKLSEQQIEAASAGLPDRILRIAENQEGHNAA